MSSQLTNFWIFKLPGIKNCTESLIRWGMGLVFWIIYSICDNLCYHKIIVLIIEYTLYTINANLKKIKFKIARIFLNFFNGFLHTTFYWD